MRSLTTGRHPDEHLEVFGDRNVDILITRVPLSFSSEGERQAEEVMEMMLPQRYRDLFWADRLRATGSTWPLLPSVLRKSLVVRDCLTTMNEVTSAVQQQEEEAVTWML